MIPYNRFTERAQHALQFAQDAAMQMGHAYVGSEHLILGLIREGSGIASRALAAYNVTEERVIRKIEELIGFNGIPLPIKGMTPRTKRIIEISFAEAQRMGQNFVGTEQLLIAILREGESVGFRVLLECGVDPQKLYNDIMRLYSGQTVSGQRMEAGAQDAGSLYANTNQYGKTSVIDQFSRDLTALARGNGIDPVLGRENEIERVVQILSRRTKNNPCLIGEPGVGKTAIVEGLAQRIVDGNLPETLKDKRVLTLDLSSMVAGTKYRGEFEERLKKAIDEVKNAKNIILFIDELHTLIGAGAAEGAIDAANILKPSLARGELQVIGATTLDEYRKYIEKDSALERRFQPIMVNEPSEDEAVAILKGIRDKYEAHHNVEITDSAIEEAVRLSVRYINDRFLPDKAIDLIDEAASKLRLKGYMAPPKLKDLDKQLEKLNNEKVEAVRQQDFEKAAKMRDKERQLKEELEKQKLRWDTGKRHERPRVTASEIEDIVAHWTGIPVKKLAESEGQRLLKLEEILHKRVVGQNDAVTSLSKAIRRGRVGLKDPKRPIGSFIFLGPTGVGKTELAKALAEAMFGSEDAIIRVDMSEYMEKHSVSRMVGSPPGYVGHEEGGQLTEKIRRKPYSVILFDEIEKAHPDVFNILLQILEDGILTDSQGRRVDFRNTVLIMTSNVGAHELQDKRFLGFATRDDAKASEDNYNKLKTGIIEELKKAFKPEFLNRIDDIIVFRPLTVDEITVIAHKMLEGLSARLAMKDIAVQYDDAVIAMLAKNSFDEKYGARPLRRAIQSKIEDYIAEELLEGAMREGHNYRIIIEDDKVRAAAIVKA